MTPQGGASGIPPRWRALLASTALVAVSVPAMPLAALLTSLTTTPAMANGGAGSASLPNGGAGGIDSPTGSGGAGGTALSSGGGGGAGATGGGGGNSGVAGGGTGGAGGSSAGSAGAAGGDGGGIASGGGGGGGGAHGFVDATLPGAASTGGAGGNGGNGVVFVGDGGGGGAGGYGAVVTGTGNLGSLGAAVTGGSGGSGGNGRNGGDGGTGGIGLFFANAGATFTVNAAVQGGTGGAGGTSIDDPGSSAGAGGTGIVGQNLTITMGAAGTVAGGSGANAITFTGRANTLTFTNATSGLTGNIGVTGSLTFDQSSIGTTVANVITGDGSVVKTGTNTITLSGANSYTGGTMVNAGTLALTGTGTLGATTNAVTVNGTTAVLDLGGTTQTQNGGVVLQGGGTIQNGTLSSSGTFDMQSGTVTAVLAGTGGVSKTTAGTVTFSRANTYTGGTTITAGTLALAGAGTLGATTNAVTVNGATAVLDLGGTTQTQNGGVVLQGGGTIQNGTLSSSGTFDMQSGTVTAVLAGTGGVSKTTAGTVTFSGANTYTGGTTITAGTLVAASNGALPTATNVAVNSGGTLEIGNGIAARISSLAGDGAVVIGSSAPATSLRIGGTSGSPSTTFSGSITGAGSLTLSRGSLTLAGASSIGGDLTVASGTTLTISGAGASFEVGGLTSGKRGVDVTGTLNVLNGATFTATQNLFVTGRMTVSGASATVNEVTWVGAIPVFSPAASLRIENGGTLNSVKDAFITNLFSRPSVTVTGAGSVWQVGGSLNVGDPTASAGLAGTLTVSNGGVVNVTGATRIAASAGLGSSMVNVTGAGSALNSTSLAIGAVAGGSNLAGVLTVAEGGVVNAAGGTTIRAAGTLNLGTGGLAGSIVTPTIANDGQIVANFTDTLTLAAGISGTGRLSKGGTGTLTLTGTNTYLGGTTINGGTLAIFQDANLGAASGALTFGGGTLQALAGFSTARAITLNAGGGTIDTNGNAVTASGPIGGVGGLTKIGAGTLTLSGNNTFAGTTNVLAGGLIVNGSVGGPVTVESGAFLGGTGSVGSTTINGGTLSPGNSIGTLTINGNLALSSASTYLVEISPTSSDRTNVTGTATLGGTVQIVAGPGTYTPGVTYTILHATGGIGGRFGGVTGKLASSDFLSPSLDYNSNNVFILISQTATLASAGRTRNQIATGSGVDSLGFGNPISDTLLLGTAAQARAAFDLLSGEVHASAAGVMLDESRYVRDAVIGRARQSYGGLQSGVLAALGPTTAAIAYAQETEDAFAALGYAAGKRPVYKAAPAAPTPNERVWAAWSQATGAWGKTDGDGNAAALDRTAAGFISGVDATFNGLWRLGLAGGYTRSSLDVDGRRSSAAMDNFHVALYGGTQQGPWGLRGGAAFTWHEIDTRRTIAFPGFFDATKANYNAHTAQVFGKIGYGIALGPTAALEPFAAIAYVNLDTDRFTETGGAASLTGGTTLDATFTTLGLRGATVLGFANGMAVTGRGTLGWRHALGDATPEMSLAFVSGGIPFTIAGAPLAKNSAVVEAGLDLAVTANAKLGVVYSGQLADTAQDHAVKGNFLWRF